MSVHSEAIMNQKFFEMIKLLKIYLNHFPKDEKFALCLSIRNTAYEVFDLITESQKRYYKKTSLTNLDIKIESIISLVGHAKGTATLRYFKRLLIEFSIFHKLPQRTQICLSM